MNKNGETTTLPQGFAISQRLPIRHILLSCGILSSILYVAVVLIAPSFWEVYDPAALSVSELFAIGAPSTGFVKPMFIIYGMLIYAFGLGLWFSAENNRNLKIAASLIIAKEILGLIGTLFAPIHMRGSEETLTDTAHAIITGVGVLLCMFPAIGFGAAAFGKKFRLYSIATMLVFLVFGIMAGFDGPRMAANLPTPYLGLWERVNIYTYMLWIIVLTAQVWSLPAVKTNGELRAARL